MIASRRPGIPSAARSSSAIFSNTSVQTVSVRMPRFSNSTESWTLHDVHAPQSPLPTRTATAPDDSFSKIASVAGSAGPWASECLSTQTVPAMP